MVGAYTNMYIQLWENVQAKDMEIQFILIIAGVVAVMAFIIWALCKLHLMKPLLTVGCYLFIGVFILLIKMAFRADRDIC